MIEFAIGAVASPTTTSLSVTSNHTAPKKAPSQTPLALKAGLQPFNTTHINVSIVNTYPQQISILSWNTHFQRNQHAAHGSFEVTYPNTNDEVQTMQRGPNMAQFFFDEAVPSHFYNISAGVTYTDLFDITDVFSIPKEGEYTVVMDFATRALLHKNDTDLATEIQAAGNQAQGFASLIVKSDPITIKLDASPPFSEMIRKRQMIPGSCAGTLDVLPQITAARQNARDLAHYARDISDNGLWVEYFNDQSQTSLVYNVYNSVTRYGANGNYYGISENCDPSNIDNYCATHEKTNAYNKPGEGVTSSITFCQRWFRLPANRTCDFPSAANPEMRDQGGVFFHELIHSPNLLGGGERIMDGDRCYDWNCVTGAAAGTNGQPKPWTIAKAFEMYAYAARALRTKFCTVDVHAVDNDALGGIVGG